MFVDSHCHLNFLVKRNFDSVLTEGEIESARIFIEEAKRNNVKKIINVGTNITESKNSITLANRYKEVFASIAIHPCDISENSKKDLKKLKKILETEKNKNKIVAIGECGIDLYREPNKFKEQADFFKAQIELALEKDLALIVHMRNSEEETIYCLEEYKNEKIRGIIHCFGGTIELAKKFIEMGFVLGIGGKVTYPKNQELREVAKSVPLEKIVLETDSPFLPPQNIRGKQNTPAQIKSIAEYLSSFLKKDLKKIEETTTKTLEKILNYSFTK